MIFMLGSVGLPGTSGFVGEFLALLGAYRVDTLVALLATTGLILGAPYMLILYRRVIFGPQVNEDAAEMLDMNWREIVCLVPLAILTIWLGVFPNMVLNKVQPSVDNLISRYEAALTTTNVATTNTGSVVAGENQ
jgi:NADH-quinone oxidoreductase subunit M